MHDKSATRNLIGTIGEKSLHSELKDWYAKPGDQLEVEVDGFYIDIKRNNLLIEIQTANFSSLRRKLSVLVKKCPMRLVYPISEQKWIVRVDIDGLTRLGRRKSPKKGNIYHLFNELVSLPELITNPNFSLEVLLVQEEEVRCNDGKGSWRRKGLSIMDRRLLGVLNQYRFIKPEDFLALVPRDLPDAFSTLELAECIDQPRWLAQKMAYCLRKMEVLDIVGKNGNALLYSTSDEIIA